MDRPRLTESEFTAYNLFKEKGTLIKVLAESTFTESTVRNYFYRLRSKGVIDGSINNYYFPEAHFDVGNLHKTRIEVRAERKVKEQAKEALKEPKKTKKDSDCGFHFVKGKRVEHPINLKPLVFENGWIRNVYPEFPKAS